VGAVALGSVGIGVAAAADIGVPAPQQSYAPAYPQRTVEEVDVYRAPPPVYVYPPVRRVYRYYYPPPVAFLPRPYHRFGYRPYFARGYAFYSRPWRRGHRW
jgi:hypothetical protein